MDDVDLEELRMLRARAYGPSADIHHDPAAQQRLNELEAATRMSRPLEVTPTAPVTESTHHPGPPPPLPADVRRPTRLAEPSVTVAGGAAAASHPRVAPRRWFLSRGFAVLWLVSLVAVAAIAAGVAFAATWMAPVTRGTDARQIATLSPDPDFDWNQAFGGSSETMRGGYTFHGLSIVVSDAGFFASGSAASGCLLAYPSANVADDTVSGPVFTGCGAGPFPATVQLTVDNTLPPELHDAVGDDAALQFVLDGDKLGVFLATP